MTKPEEFMDHRMLSWELVRSIKEIDVRIEELKIVLGAGPCPGQPERRQKIVERVERLIYSRFCLVYSLMDINPSFKKSMGESSNPFETIDTRYEALKRHY